MVRELVDDLKCDVSNKESEVYSLIHLQLCRKQIVVKRGLCLMAVNTFQMKSNLQLGFGRLVNEPMCLLKA